ncbi:hypothetical protein ABZX75_03645 [Streptomyces sp. NPDC003038]|uniref:hypothetical protein n=1 Tax=unclassified Streptomyces TaxID=2593676 RepID=UPI0033BD9B19
MTTASHQPSEEVVVAVSDCSEKAGRTVLDVLEHAFSTDSRPATGSRATVWTATLDVAKPRVRAAPAHLDGRVSVGLQGGYRAVDQVLSALAEAFTIDMGGTAAGDQEKDVQLWVRSG